MHLEWCVENSAWQFICT